MKSISALLIVIVAYLFIAEETKVKKSESSFNTNIETNIDTSYHKSLELIEVENEIDSYKNKIKANIGYLQGHDN